MKLHEIIRNTAASAALSALAAWAFDACAPFASCDPDQRLQAGLCLPAGGSPPSADAGTVDGSGPPASCSGDAASTGEFGRACTAQADCSCPAPVCAIQPGAKSGYCTQIACDRSPEVCPAGFRCVDLSVINPSYPFTCLQNG